MNWKTVFLMIISTVAFAIVNSIIKYFEEYSEFQLVFFRCVISLIISVFQLRLLKISPWGNNKPVLILRGFAGVLALIMGFVLIKNVPLGTAIMLNYLSPIFTAFIAVFWLKEKVKPLQ
jgi:drug/metabolite transporter (DMT)-like permease